MTYLLIIHLVVMLSLFVKKTLLYRSDLNLTPACDQQYTIFYSMFPFNLDARVPRSYSVVYILASLFLVPMVVMDKQILFLVFSGGFFILLLANDICQIRMLRNKSIKSLSSFRILVFLTDIFFAIIVLTAYLFQMHRTLTYQEFKKCEV